MGNKNLRYSLLATTIAGGLMFFTAPGFAESVERAWKDPAAKKPAAPTGIINSILPKKVETPKIVRKKRRRVRNRRKSSVKTSTSPKSALTPVARTSAKTEGKWWNSVGNPAVFAFRDCSKTYAQSQINAGNRFPASDLIANAMKTDCQIEFAKMAGVLIGGLGETKSNAMLKELASTTFLPAIRKMLQKDQQKRELLAQSKVAKVDHRTKLASAKSEMFKCFVEKTDRLSVAQSTSANTIADAVLVGCSAISDRFFDLLLANSKARPQVKLQQKNIAMNETYRQAIVKRVLATRGKAQIKTAIGASN